jgi:23S rRNA (adenine1618-N6)-methyltransferase
MGQGNKTSRLVAWTYLDTAHQQSWIKTRWKEI